MHARSGNHSILLAIMLICVVCKKEITVCMCQVEITVCMREVAITVYFLLACLFMLCAKRKSLKAFPCVSQWYNYWCRKRREIAVCFIFAWSIVVSAQASYCIGELQARRVAETIVFYAIVTISLYRNSKSLSVS